MNAFHFIRLPKIILFPLFPHLLHHVTVVVERKRRVFHLAGARVFELTRTVAVKAVVGAP